MHVNWSDRVSYDVGPNIFNLGLGEFMRIFHHSSRSASVRSDTDVGYEDLAHSLRFSSSQKCWVEVRGLCRAVLRTFEL